MTVVEQRAAPILLRNLTSKLPSGMTNLPVLGSGDKGMPVHLWRFAMIMVFL